MCGFLIFLVIVVLILHILRGTEITFYPPDETQKINDIFGKQEEK